MKLFLSALNDMVKGFKKAYSKSIEIGSGWCGYKWRIITVSKAETAGRGTVSHWLEYSSVLALFIFEKKSVIRTIRSLQVPHTQTGLQTTRAVPVHPGEVIHRQLGLPH